MGGRGGAAGRSVCTATCCVAREEVETGFSGLVCVSFWNRGPRESPITTNICGCSSTTIRLKHCWSFLRTHQWYCCWVRGQAFGGLLEDGLRERVVTYGVSIALLHLPSRKHRERLLPSYVLKRQQGQLKFMGVDQ